MKNRIYMIFALLFFILILFSLNSCTSYRLSSFKSSASPSTLVVVKTEKGGYLAFTGACIKKTEGKKVTLKAGSPIASGSGTSTSQKISDALIELMSKSNVGGFGMTSTKTSDQSGDVSGEIYVTDQDLEVDVSEIVDTKNLK
jgi:hypothetical protein